MIKKITTWFNIFVLLVQFVLILPMTSAFVFESYKIQRKIFKENDNLDRVLKSIATACDDLVMLPALDIALEAPYIIMTPREVS